MTMSLLPATHLRPAYAAAVFLFMTAPYPAASHTPSKSTYFSLPGAAYLQGIGTVYGGAAGTRDILKSSGSLTAFMTFGEVRSGGLLLTGLPLGSDRLTLTLGFGLISEADFKTGYGRGFGEGLVVRQVMKGNGVGLRLNYHAVADRLSFFTENSFTALKFVDYKTRSGEVIPIKMSELHDVETRTMTVGVSAGLFEPLGEDPNRLRITAKHSTVEGRIAQSDLRILNFKAHGFERITRRWSLAYTGSVQRTLVAAAAGPGGFSGDCHLIADIELRRQCGLLERDLRDYIAQSNRVGTGAPLGGAGGLRSYRELRFKAANTSLLGFEARLEVYPPLHAEIIAFYELGYASDRMADLYAKSRYSTGVGLRIQTGRLPVRAEFAHGAQGRAGFLTFGLPW